MTEEEFKTNYIKSFLEAYRSVVGFKEFYFPNPLSKKEELLQLAKDKAEIAWKEHKDTAV